MTETEKKYFKMLENNPEVMVALARKLGLSDDLTFYDVYSLDEADLSYIPRPVYALIVIIPMTPAWKKDRDAEDEALGDPAKYYHGGAAASQKGDEPIIWFEQTIGDACGSYAFLHCAINGDAKKFIQPGSALEKLRHDAIPLAKAERAKMLYDNEAFEEAHRSVEVMGDTAAERTDHLGQHFIGYVKANSHLWELEGCRQGPLDRGVLDENEDVLSQKALDLGLKRVVKLELASGGQDLRFSCVALAPKT
ncbi:ubiquitin carboxyl-terminal hydrolase isozyme L3 [Podospora australis]|uniref:Ubiquitin carboxyl-terminal hydrolase n=1 Tax=Podospora australis TaxID=1536484 RepID=A0AAN6WYY2_9PEZI|nr:ubiquitin carboxyl-terminal hydrolase isozyme L3 [Podospora australis]